MTTNSTDPIWTHKVTRVICKKCQFEGVQADFNQQDVIGFICPKCGEQEKLQFNFDNGRQYNRGSDWIPPRSLITSIVAGIIFLVSANYITAPYFQLLTVFLLGVVVYVMYTDQNRGM